MMKLFFKPLFGVWLVLSCATIAMGQTMGPKIDRVDVKFVGPASVSEEFVRANIRLKAGTTYRQRPRKTTSIRFMPPGSFITSACRWTRPKTAEWC